MKKFNKKFLFITFAITFIVILISIFSINIITKKINNDPLKASETNARNRLNNVLSLASSEKENNAQYNNESFLTNFLTSNGFIVHDDIVSLDNWNFEIDRENLVIRNNLGATTVTLTDEFIEILGYSSANILVKTTSNINIDTIIFENADGTFTTEKVNGTFFEKEITISPDKTYTVTIITSDGKTSLKTIQRNSSEFIPTSVEYGEIYSLDTSIGGNKDISQIFASNYKDFELNKNFIYGIYGSGEGASTRASISNISSRYKIINKIISN